MRTLLAQNSKPARRAGFGRLAFARGATPGQGMMKTFGMKVQTFLGASKHQLRIEIAGARICSLYSSHNIFLSPRSCAGAGTLESISTAGAMCAGTAFVSRTAMNYPEQYRAELLSAIQRMDLNGVSAAIEVFREARAQGHRIFVCGSGRSAVASHLLCEMVKGSTLTRASKFRIFALTGELPVVGRGG